MSERLRELLFQAVGLGASTVLFVVGNPPALRLQGQVQSFPGEPPLRYQDTQPLAETLMTPQSLADFNAEGAVEIPFQIGTARGRVHIYYAQGSHNLVFTLDPR